MTYQVLYRKYRPKTFDDVVGQDVIVKTLKNAIKANKIAHAYLFCGPHGTGKTTIAKIFAKAINCEAYDDGPCGRCESCLASDSNIQTDIIEMDAASNNGVESIRDIIEKAQYTPAISKYRVYIIDEVHMLTKQAFNALLKTLEEPPKHVVFILATTDPNKIIPTVLSRVQRYNFNKVSSYHMINRIKEILDLEAISYDDQAINTLVRLADGGMRDALSMLDQCLAYDNELNLENVNAVYGLATVKDKINIIKNLHRNEVNEVNAKVNELDKEGVDIKLLCIDLIDILKEAILFRSYHGQASDCLKIMNIDEVQSLIQDISIDTMIADIDALLEVINRQKYSQNIIFYFELALLKMANHKEKTILVEEKVKENKKPSPVVEKEIKAVATKSEQSRENNSFIQTETKTLTEVEAVDNKEPSKSSNFFFDDLDIETPTLEEIPLEDYLIKYQDEELLNILFTANRDEKQKDLVILNNIGEYEFDVNNRKFYQTLRNSEIFASNKEMIIFCGDDYEIAKINNSLLNEELYFFIKEKYGIDKMVYAIDTQKRGMLVKQFTDAKQHPENYHIDSNYRIERYKQNNKRVLTDEERLKELFGDKMKVED